MDQPRTGQFSFLRQGKRSDISFKITLRVLKGDVLTIDAIIEYISIERSEKYPFPLIQNFLSRPSNEKTIIPLDLKDENVVSNLIVRSASLSERPTGDMHIIMYIRMP